MAPPASLGRLLHVTPPGGSFLDMMATGSVRLDPHECSGGARPSQLPRLVAEVNPAALGWIIPARSYQVRGSPSVIRARAFIDAGRRVVDVDDIVAVQYRWSGCDGCGATCYAGDRGRAQQYPDQARAIRFGKKHRSSCFCRHDARSRGNDGVRAREPGADDALGEGRIRGSGLGELRPGRGSRTLEGVKARSMPSVANCHGTGTGRGGGAGESPPRGNSRLSRRQFCRSWGAVDGILTGASASPGIRFARRRA